MPCVENWKSNPLHIVNNLFEKRSDDQSWKKEISKYFSNKLENLSTLQLISSLNDEPLHSIHSEGLVRFRCMIQDTFEPEYFLETYEVVDKSNGNKTMHTSRYRDIVTCKEGCEVMMESERNETGCRQVLYCVSIPGETNWVKEKYKTNCKQPSSSYNATSGLKRSHDDGEEETMEHDTEPVNQSNDCFANKRSRLSQNSSNVTQQTLTKNHPLPDEDGPVCIVKVYDEATDFKVNEIYEFVGVLSVDPELSSAYDTPVAENNGLVNGHGTDAEQIAEQKAHSPPASFVPRLHCIQMFRLQHNNPCIPLHQSIDAAKQELTANAPILRQEILNFLKQATFGDELTAEYLLCHLIARVYSRTGLMAVGKMSLNISGIPLQSCYAKLLSDLLKEVLTKAFYLRMSLENMNKLHFTPTKNYSTNRLDSGILQLSEGTHMVVDESALQPGQLDQNGVKNIQALGTLLTQQKVDYNFQFHPVVFQHNIPILVLSEGKSMLPCDCQVLLKPQIPISSDITSYFKQFTISEDIMNKFRLFFTIVKFSEYELDESMMKTIENDFVTTRQANSDNMTPEDLHAHLVLARSLCISWGESKLREERWKTIRDLENERKQRLLH
uniref:Mini-chromosome maintenance complex-binding protein n=1 Tax=Phallusia mammillata TaxID=59560 RepID=A0A6F9DKY9_9ASCI|nr:mini-chromosome maintenance complex-binding protein [Phallusia mammillata]